MKKKARHIPLPSAAFLVALLLFAFLLYWSYGVSAAPQNSSTARTIAIGTRISNFLLQEVNADGTVSGRLYILYPVAYVNGTPVTLVLGSMIGYACDGSEWKLLSVNAYNDTATFSFVPTKTGPCPI